MKTITILTFGVLAAVALGMVFQGGSKQTKMEESPKRKDKVVLTEAEWKKKLTPEQYAILRGHGTERAFCGVFHNFKDKGVYFCVGCDLPLFRADDKFDSGTGWPSFSSPMLRAIHGSRPTRASAWSARRCFARAATAISAMSLTTAPNQPDCGSASTQRS